MEKNKENIAKICEIAYIVGKLEGKNILTQNDMDLYEMYDNIYKPIFDEWSNGINNNIFKNKEEEGYITAYAERRLIDLYK